MDTRLNWLFLFFFVTQFILCFGQEIRLQGPLSSNGTGRVEVFYNGQWGTVCDDSWDINDATVVCRQLGYPYTLRALQGYQVEDGTGQIWLDNVACNGGEQNLTSCLHNGWGRHNCRHSDDAGVECSLTVPQVGIRLQGPSSSRGIGRVEVFFNGRWGTVCDDSWDISDARVACRQLGYQNAVRALQGSQVVDGTGQIWLDEVACTGSEQNLASCRHNGWGRHDCGHSEDAGVECSLPVVTVNVRLRGPFSSGGIGRVEVFYNETWGTICGDRWDINDARVVCRQLGYQDQNAVKALQGSQVVHGTGRIWLDEVACSGREQNLGSCLHGGWGSHDCSHSEDAGVECSPRPVIPDPVIYNDCVEAHRTSCNDRNGGSLFGLYSIKARNEDGHAATLCADERNTNGCEGNGWTFVGYANGNPFSNITSYNAERWTSRNPYQLESTHFDANVSAVCLSSEDFGISFPVQAPNFHSLFFGKKILNLNPQDWINGTRDPGFAINNFQEGCFEIGFNVGDENEIQARIGVVSKNNTGCNLSEIQGIGVGIRVAGRDYYNSVHGVIVGGNLTFAYQDFKMFVRSRPWN